MESSEPVFTGLPDLAESVFVVLLSAAGFELSSFCILSVCLDGVSLPELSPSVRDGLSRAAGSGVVITFPGTTLSIKLPMSDGLPFPNTAKAETSTMTLAAATVAYLTKGLRPGLFLTTASNGTEFSKRSGEASHSAILASKDETTSSDGVICSLML